MVRKSWRIQAHWRVGDEQKSYQPTYVRTRLQTRKAARDMARTLSHFVDLRITVDPVDRSTADDALAERDRVLANIRPALLHLFDAAHVGALCGTPVDERNALATADMQELSSGPRCTRCAELASS
ncbi:MAG: hypothetical protein ABMA25_04620 [Ilumatobacteraceae bacterium]